MSGFEEFFDDTLDVLGDIVEAGSVSLIDKAIEARYCGSSNPVSALGETVAKIFDVDLDDVCDNSSPDDTSDNGSSNDKSANENPENENNSEPKAFIAKPYKSDNPFIM